MKASPHVAYIALPSSPAFASNWIFHGNIRLFLSTYYPLSKSGDKNSLERISKMDDEKKFKMHANKTISRVGGRKKKHREWLSRNCSSVWQGMSTGRLYSPCQGSEVTLLNKEPTINSVHCNTRRREKLREKCCSCFKETISAAMQPSSVVQGHRWVGQATFSANKTGRLLRMFACFVICVPTLGLCCIKHLSNLLLLR